MSCHISKLFFEKKNPLHYTKEVNDWVQVESWGILQFLFLNVSSFICLFCMWSHAHSSEISNLCLMKPFKRWHIMEYENPWGCSFFICAILLYFFPYKCLDLCYCWHKLGNSLGER